MQTVLELNQIIDNLRKQVHVLEQEVITWKIKEASARGYIDGLKESRPSTLSLPTYDLKPLNREILEDNVKHLTSDHLLNGEKGIALYLIEYPFKNKVVCTSKSKKILIYKDAEGKIINDTDGLMNMVYDVLKPEIEKLWQYNKNHYIKQMYGDDCDNLTTTEISRRLGVFAECKKMNPEFKKKILSQLCLNI